MDLQEWTIHYVKYKDSIARKLVKFDVVIPWIHFSFKDKEHWYLIQNQLNDQTIEKLNTKEYKTVVCDYTKSNLDFVIKHWNKLITLKNLWILFANPQDDKKMLLNPLTHHYVADPETLEDGLRGLFDPEAASLKPEKKRAKLSKEEEEAEEALEEDE